MNWRMVMKYIAMVMIAALTFQPVMLWAGDSWKEINELAEEDMKQLDEGVINVEKFIGEPWYKRHMGKLIAGSVIVIGGVAIICTGGLAAPAVGAGAAHVVGTGAALGVVDTLGAAAVTAGAGIYIDSGGNIEIPENKRWEVKKFYRDNYRSWVSRSSTKKEFGEIAIREIVQFLERNK